MWPLRSISEDLSMHNWICHLHHLCMIVILCLNDIFISSLWTFGALRIPQPTDLSIIIDDTMHPPTQRYNLYSHSAGTNLTHWPNCQPAHTFSCRSSDFCSAASVYSYDPTSTIRFQPCCSFQIGHAVFHCTYLSISKLMSVTISPSAESWMFQHETTTSIMFIVFLYRKVYQHIFYHQPSANCVLF